MTAVHPLLPDDPERLGPYQVKGRLGEGGQSVVFLGEGDDGREVAIKLLRASLSQSPEWRARFEREMELIGRVAGFCTAQVLDSDISGELPYVVSEYVPGPSLTELVTGDAGPRVGTDLDRLAIGTVTALAAIHRAGILHRDFKPANVLMGPDGPRVIDFGIARVMGSAASRGSGVVGTPSYMAPEQVTDTELGPGVDMFAWGATILFAATGRHPFGNDTISAVFHRVLNYEPDMSALPDSLRPVVAACLAKDPAYRPGAQQALLQLLGSQETVVAGAESPLTTGATFAGGAVGFSGPAGFAGPAGFGGGAMGSGGGTGPGLGPGAGPGTEHPATHPPHHTIPPRKGRARWRIAVAIATPLLLLAGGGTAYALMAGDEKKPVVRTAADTAAPPADTAAVVGHTTRSLKAVMDFDYRKIDQNIAAAHAKSTPGYRAQYDRDLEKNDWRNRLTQSRSTVVTEIADSAVIASSETRVVLLSAVRRTATAPNAEPTVTKQPMRVTMVKQGGTWLLDSLLELRANTPDGVPPADPSWPATKGRAVLDGIGRSQVAAGGRRVEAAVRPGGSESQVTALVAVGACPAEESCKATDKISTYRLELHRRGNGAWQVARTETL